MSGQPDYTLRVIAADSQRFGTIGGGWTRDKGQIYLRIDPGCALMFNPLLKVVLVPVKERAA